MSRSFAAAYRGMCAECDGPIEPGQSVCFTGVARRGGDLRHMACPDDVRFPPDRGGISYKE